MIPYNPMIAHPTQIFQATREARLISDDVEAPSVEDEGLGAEEVLIVTTTKLTTLFIKREFCHKMMIFLTFTQDTSESEKTELKTLRSLFDQAKLDNRWRISQFFIFLF